MGEQALSSSAVTAIDERHRLRDGRTASLSGVRGNIHARYLRPGEA
jgi:hypothetical protein